MIILRGPQGSGKTTWAIQYMTENPNYLLVSRDAIRESLIPNHRATWYQRPDRDRLEQLVNRLVYVMIDNCYNRGFDVIVDETNPDITRLRAIYWDKEVAIHDMTTPLEECIRRDALREYPVGEEIIRRTAKKLNYAF